MWRAGGFAANLAWLDAAPGGSMIRHAVAAALLASALAAPALTTPARAGTPKDALVMAWNLDALITFDPAQIGEVNGNDIVGNVCDTLVKYDPKDVSRVIPAMAQSWSTSPDGLTLTFKLRPDLKFPDGSKATAQDAAWSMQRFVLLGYGNSANLTQWGFTKAGITDEIKALDDSTLQVKLTKPYPVELILSAAFANNDAGMILEKSVGEKNAKMVDGKSDYGNAFFKTNPVCVGPYRVTKWNSNDVVVLTRNDHYWGSKPHSRRVIIRHVPESGAERLLLEKGDIDVPRLLKTEDLLALEKEKDIRIAQTLMHGFTYLALNSTDPILAKPQVREAFRYLIDYDGLGRTLLKFQGEPRASLVPLGAFGALDAKAGQPFKLDLEKAKALITEAGYPDGFSAKMILSANGISPDVAQSIASNAAKIGIKISLEQMADAQLFTRGRARDFEIQLIGWGAGYPDADSMISRHAVDPDPRAEAKLAQYPSWRTAWFSQKINDEAEAARMERDPAKRIAMYHEIQDYMMHNGPMAYIYQTVRAIAMRKAVKDFVITPFSVDYGSAVK
jgi:peptide/nickel transport system substrate-binding protein